MNKKIIGIILVGMFLMTSISGFSLGATISSESNQNNKSRADAHVDFDIDIYNEYGTSTIKIDQFFIPKFYPKHMNPLEIIIGGTCDAGVDFGYKLVGNWYFELKDNQGNSYGGTPHSFTVYHSPEGDKAYHWNGDYEVVKWDLEYDIVLITARVWARWNRFKWNDFYQDWDFDSPFVEYEGDTKVGVVSTPKSINKENNYFDNGLFTHPYIFTKLQMFLQRLGLQY